MTPDQELEARINANIRKDPDWQQFQKNCRKIMDDIVDGYGVPIYYLWNTGELVWEKPTVLYSPLYKPDYTPEVMGIEIGSLVADENGYYGFCGQVSFISISQNRIEAQKGPKMRGSGCGSSLDIIPKLKILVKGSDLVKMYEKQRL